MDALRRDPATLIGVCEVPGQVHTLVGSAGPSLLTHPVCVHLPGWLLGSSSWFVMTPLFSAQAMSWLILFFE
jgi:hypothetical protein